MKAMKKNIVILLGIIMMLSGSACGAEEVEKSAGTESAVNAETMSEAGAATEPITDAEIVADTEIIAEAESAAEEDSVLKDEAKKDEFVMPTPFIEKIAEFDEEFTLQLGDNVGIGREDTSIFLKELEYAANLESTMITYELKIGDTVYEGVGDWEPDKGGRIVQEVYTTNAIQFISADRGESVTLMITSGKEIKQPISLSGNAEDKFVTAQPEYIESDDFIIFLDEGITVQGNLEEQFKTIFGLVEKEFGYNLVNDSRFSLVRERDLDWYFEKGTFDSVDPNMEKFHIYVVPAEKASPYCNLYSIVVNPIDLEIAAGEGMAIVHELTHAIQFTNGVDMGTTMNEGIATYITGKICDKDEIIPFHFDADFNYEWENPKITVENAEQLFLNEQGDGWENYLYGYNFITFLCENYGEHIYRDIFDEATKQAGSNATTFTGNALITVIKEKTSEDVFAKFAERMKG